MQGGCYRNESVALGAVRRLREEILDQLRLVVLPMFADTLAYPLCSDEPVLQQVLATLCPENEVNPRNQEILASLYQRMGPDERAVLLNMPPNQPAHARALAMLRKRIKRLPDLGDRCELLFPKPPRIQNLRGLGFALNSAGLVDSAPSRILAD